MLDKIVRVEEQTATDLWKALLATSTAQHSVIADGNAEALEALLLEKERLMAALAQLDPARDTERDPSLLTLALAVQEQELAAQAALRAAQAEVVAKLTTLRARRTAQRAFFAGTGALPSGAPDPRFLDKQG